MGLPQSETLDTVKIWFTSRSVWIVSHNQAPLGFLPLASTILLVVPRHCSTRTAIKWPNGVKLRSREGVYKVFPS